MTRPDVTLECTYSPHSGPVGCLPAPNNFPLAKETFAKGKMFCSLKYNPSNEIFTSVPPVRLKDL